MADTLLLYGSESGMTEDIADQVSYKLLHHSINHTISSFEDLNMKKYIPLLESQSIKNIIVISSTAGQGELPLNIRTSELWKYLKTTQLDLSATNFYFLGIGDSLYLKFQHAIRLLKLRICDRFNGIFKFKLEIDVTGMKGDGSTEQVLPIFINNLVKELSTTQDYINDKVYISKGSVLRRKTVEFDDKIVSTIHKPKLNWFESEIMANNRVTNHNHFSDIRQLIFKNTNNLTYAPGDTISIRPQNDDSSINKFFELQPHLLQYRYEKVLVQNEDDVSEELFEDILRYEVDFKSVPKRNFFMKLWNFQSLGSDDVKIEVKYGVYDAPQVFGSTSKENVDNDDLQILESHKSKLFDFGHSLDAYDFIEYVIQARRNILEILFDFEYIKIPFEFMLQILPIIKERQYSISSSDLTTENFEITAKVLEYETVLLEKRKGFCTNYIKNLVPGGKVSIKLNYLNLWDKLEEPIMQGSESIILIGPGVGIAPIKSFCDNEDYKSFEKYVYFGNRKKEMDYIYQSFWENKDRSDMIVRTCFSRDNEKEKYVQDMLWNDKALVYDLVVNKNAIIYICGSSGQMPTQVKLTFIEIIKTLANDEKAEEYVNEMIKSNRYIQETW
ncbi:hypothetical protein FOG50_01228 [Hanseniaspora uvarum]|nr:hypothetical protein FOG50_01228 [Hanseniaspora uvarum]